MRLAFRRVSLAFGAILAILAGPVFAQDTSLVALVDKGEFEAARTQLANAGGSSLDHAFLDALILEKRGAQKAAIARLRDVLRARPDLVPVRRRLTRLLLRTGQTDAAEFQLERLLELDPDTTRHADYRIALQRIKATRPYGVSASFALVPSSNVNRGTTNEIYSSEFGDFVIDEESKETTGLGLLLGVSTYRRVQLDDGQALQFNLSGSGTFYEAEEYDRVTVAASMDYQVGGNGTSWSLSPQYRRSFLGGDHDFDAFALSYQQIRSLDRTKSLRFVLRAEDRTYAEKDYLDGVRVDTSLTLRTLMSPRTAVEATVGYHVGNLASEQFQYDGVEIGGRVIRGFRSGWQLSGGISYEYRPFRGDFAGGDFPREDRTTSVTFSAFNSRWSIRGAAPRLECQLAWSESNIAFYDYSVQECTIGITRRF